MLSAPAIRGAAATLAVGLLLAGGAASAQSISVAYVPPGTIGPGQPSTFAVDVTYTNTAANPPDLRTLQIAPFNANTGYMILSATGPTADWTLGVDAQGTKFLAVPCEGPGIAAGATVRFMVTVQGPADASDGNAKFTFTGITGSGASTCPGDPVTAARYSTTASVPVKILLVTGVASPPNLPAPGSTTITWTITNASATARNVLLSRSPSGSDTGSPPLWTAMPCTGDFTKDTIPAGTTRTITCPYTVNAMGSYDFAATLTPQNGGTQTQVTLTVYVGRTAAWDHGAVVMGRPTTLTVFNGTGAACTRVDLRNAYPSGMVVTSASATGALSYDPGQSTSKKAIFTGSLASGQSSVVTVNYAAASVPATSSTDFTVLITCGSGALTLSLTPGTPLLVPLPDVRGLSILDTSTAQRLEWSNVDGNGSTHDGVVVFRSADGVAPGPPSDFTQYAVGDLGGAVVYASTGTSTGPEGWTDPIAPGRYRYRVCNHDKRFVYSSCSTNLWNGQGWLDSAAAPAGGWTRQLGMSALKLIGVLPGGRSAAVSNQPEATVLDLATGARIGSPVALYGIPSVNTAGTQVVDGRSLAFAADDAGFVNAFNLADGTPGWSSALNTGESFTAGITGITRSWGSAAFQASYAMDVLLLGSARDTGTVVAVHAGQGTVLWRLPTGSTINGLVTYDADSDLLVVPTGTRVVAYDMSKSSSSQAPSATPVWTVTGDADTTTATCSRTTLTSLIACVDTGGTLRVIDKASGRVTAQLETGVARPTTLARMMSGQPGFAVASASKVVRVVANADFTSLTAPYGWAPGSALTPLLSFSSSGYLIVGCDLRLCRRSSDDLHDMGTSAAIVPEGSRGTVTLGAPSFYDVPSSTNDLFLFGTSEGRVWAMPKFF